MTNSQAESQIENPNVWARLRERMDQMAAASDREADPAISSLIGSPESMTKIESFYEWIRSCRIRDWWNGGNDGTANLRLPCHGCFSRE